MRKILILLFLINAWCAKAQHKVKFILREETSIKHDSIYITGSFNNWDSTHNPAYRMKKEAQGLFSITLNLRPGTYYYKYSRGDWFKVEKDFAGNELRDRIINVPGKTQKVDTVYAWRDQVISDKWHALSKELSDSARLRSYYGLANVYGYYPEWYNKDSAFFYIKEALLLLQKIKGDDGYDANQKKAYTIALIEIQRLSADLLHALGNFSKALELRLDNVKIGEQLKDTHFFYTDYYGIATEYASMQDYTNMLKYSKKIYQHITSRNIVFGHFNSVKLIALAYFKSNQLDSALYYANKIYDSPPHDYTTPNNIKANAHQIIGDINLKMGKPLLAYSNYNASLQIAYPNFAYESGIRSQFGLAQILYNWGKKDSALYYAKEALRNIHYWRNELEVQGANHHTMMAEMAPFVAQLYKENNIIDSAYHYLKLSVTIKDSLYNLEKIRQFQNLSFNESLRSKQQEQEILIARQQYRAKIKIFVLIAGIGLISVLAIILYRNNRQKQRTNEKIEKAYSTLRDTQNQLIQSEKMASLGELTAGIAHEIQNPLNFINNFSEVNTELLTEMKNEIDKGNYAEVKALADDVISNEQKINIHGKRADGIVKGMLQHSRNNSGVKEPTDINVLADEYLRLAYHGLRAKDKTFNATFKTDFDESIEKVNIIPQDIGRVILNLITNAFYAVSERRKTEKDNSYNPTVLVSTKNLGNKIMVSVNDNGNGIPHHVLDKIYQPFFSTKPTGKGTGLGLSMSYDIIKAHGGELKVETAEGSGTTFYFELKT